VRKNSVKVVGILDVENMAIKVGDLGVKPISELIKSLDKEEVTLSVVKSETEE
jgi:NADH/NAD ratio-sensing transcriptional regulator Rex